MACEFCNIVNGEGKSIILYEDERAIIAARDTALTPGQITVFPKVHVPIIELVSDDLFSHCAVLANAVSIVLFERLGSKGTNILVRNGLGAGQSVPHVAIEVIPRQENDGLALTWEAKQLMEDEMERVFVLLKEEIGTLQSSKRDVPEERTAQRESAPNVDVEQEEQSHSVH